MEDFHNKEYFYTEHRTNCVETRKQEVKRGPIG